MSHDAVWVAESREQILESCRWLFDQEVQLIVFGKPIVTPHNLEGTSTTKACGYALVLPKSCSLRSLASCDISDKRVLIWGNYETESSYPRNGDIENAVTNLQWKIEKRIGECFDCGVGGVFRVNESAIPDQCITDENIPVPEPPIPDKTPPPPKEEPVVPPAPVNSATPSRLAKAEESLIRMEAMEAELREMIKATKEELEEAEEEIIEIECRQEERRIKDMKALRKLRGRMDKCAAFLEEDRPRRAREDPAYAKQVQMLAARLEARSRSREGVAAKVEELGLGVNNESGGSYKSESFMTPSVSEASDTTTTPRPEDGPPEELAERL